MITEIKTMLGDAAANYTDAQIQLAYTMALSEIKAYCNRDIDSELEYCADRIAIIKLNRMNTEGLESQSYSGVSESYVNGYPQDIQAVLNRKRKVKVVSEFKVKENTPLPHSVEARGNTLIISGVKESD